MCGIFGIINRNKGGVQIDELNGALSQLQHRGPDMSDVYVDAQIGLAHHRLSIFDTSELAKQPMEAFGLVIVFNGAIYNYPEIRDDLRAKGYSFTSDSDTEVILAAYAEYGKACLSMFNGQWSFLIYDKEKQTVFCARDRFGIKPFYYLLEKDRVSIASEIKSFTTFKNWNAKINPVRVFEYLEYGMHDHTKETMFKDVLQLERGHCMTIDISDFSVEIQEYYSLANVKEKEYSADEAISKVRTLLKNSIDLRLRADVESASALSGGLDSSVIALHIAESVEKNYKTYSVVYAEEKFNEKEYVDEVLKNPKLEGNILAPTFEEFLRDLDTLVWHQEEPFNGLAVYAQFALFKKAAKDGVRVMLDGQGADEIFAGYEKFFLPVFKNLLVTNPIRAAKLFKTAKDSFPQINAKENLVQYLKKGKKKNETCIHLAFDESRLFKREPEDTILKMSRNLLSSLGVSALLRYEDRNAMAHGIESRVPYLDHHLVECALSLSDGLKIREGVTKWVLREASKDLLPQRIYSRKDKLGFATPEKKWMKEHLAYIKSVLLESKKELEPIVHLDELFAEGDTKKLFRVFIFSRWLSVFNINLEH